MNRGVPIVIVEDDDAHRDLIVHLFKLVAPQSSVIALGAVDGDDLEELAPFGALVILDRRLGARDSIELIRPLRRARADLSVAVMSAFVTPEDRAACLGVGAGTVFQKPGDLNGWRSILGALLGDGPGLAQAA